MYSSRAASLRRQFMEISEMFADNGLAGDLPRLKKLLTAREIVENLFAGLESLVDDCSYEIDELESEGAEEQEELIDALNEVFIYADMANGNYNNVMSAFDDLESKVQEWENESDFELQKDGLLVDKKQMGADLGYEIDLISRSLDEVAADLEVAEMADC